MDTEVENAIYAMVCSGILGFIWGWLVTYIVMSILHMRRQYKQHLKHMDDLNEISDLVKKL